MQQLRQVEIECIYRVYVVCVTSWNALENVLGHTSACETLRLGLLASEVGIDCLYNNIAVVTGFELEHVLGKTFCIDYTCEIPSTPSWITRNRLGIVVYIIIYIHIYISVKLKHALELTYSGVYNMLRHGHPVYFTWSFVEHSTCKLVVDRVL